MKTTKKYLVSLDKLSVYFTEAVETQLKRINPELSIYNFNIIELQRIMKHMIVRYYLENEPNVRFHRTGYDIPPKPLDEIFYQLLLKVGTPIDKIDPRDLHDLYTDFLEEIIKYMITIDDARVEISPDEDSRAKRYIAYIMRNAIIFEEDGDVEESKLKERIAELKKENQHLRKLLDILQACHPVSYNNILSDISSGVSAEEVICKYMCK